jgi:hypothetical protein
MEILNQLLTIPMIIFCLVIFVLVWIQRKLVELLFPKAKDFIFWRELLLPLGPAGTGAILGILLTSYPVPESLTSLVGRIFYGVACGLASATIYRMLKTFLVEKSGGKSEEILDKTNQNDLPPSV